VADYKLLRLPNNDISDYAERVLDGAFVNRFTNEDYLSWIAVGNTPDAADSIEPSTFQQVPMWAVRTVLQNDGLFNQAQTLIETSTDNALKNVWGYGNFADRNSKSIASLAAALNLTDAQVDQMFIDANNIEV